MQTGNFNDETASFAPMFEYEQISNVNRLPGQNSTVGLNRKAILLPCYSFWDTELVTGLFKSCVAPCYCMFQGNDFRSSSLI